MNQSGCSTYSLMTWPILVDHFSYDPATHVLEIAFHSSGIYQYSGVPPHIHSGLMNASSKGQYFDAHIKKAGYPYRKVG
ncbi:KTSC domain-containing protein (plasmid) [Morganella morganii]|uniref:KTSC domain-containing protein n=1 Tax=Morganella morganii TaxID=582 RepID=UPI00339CBC85